MEVIAYIDELIVDLFEKLAGFWFFPDFDSKGDVRRLDYVTPEASNKNIVFWFFLTLRWPFIIHFVSVAVRYILVIYFDQLNLLDLFNKFIYLNLLSEV